MGYRNRLGTARRRLRIKTGRAPIESRCARSSVARACELTAAGVALPVSRATETAGASEVRAARRPPFCAESEGPTRALRGGSSNESIVRGGVPLAKLSFVTLHSLDHRRPKCRA